MLLMLFKYIITVLLKPCMSEKNTYFVYIYMITYYGVNFDKHLLIIG